MDGELRASDADRAAAADQLRLGMGEGRLTVDELEDRLESVYRASTRAELDRLVVDLPPAAEVTAAAPGARTPVRSGPGGTSLLVSAMGRVVRRGHWRLARRCVVVSLMGRTTLDLRDVELAADQVDLIDFSVMGRTKITVPDSLRVEVSKVSLMGSFRVDLGTARPDPGGPLLRLRVVSVMGHGSIRRAGGGAGRGRRRVGGRGSGPDELDA